MIDTSIETPSALNRSFADVVVLPVEQKLFNRMNSVSFPAIGNRIVEGVGAHPEVHAHMDVAYWA